MFLKNELIKTNINSIGLKLKQSSLDIKGELK